MQTIVEIPLTRPNPRHLIVGADVAIERVGLGSDLPIKGTISGLLIKKRHNYRSSDDPYQITLFLRAQEADGDMEFDLDDVAIIYEPEVSAELPDEPPPDSCIYLG